MIIYFICLILILLIFIMMNQNKMIIPVDRNKLSKRLFWGIALVLAVVSAIRYDVGTDYNTYVKIYFDNVTTVKEPGYMLLCAVSSFFGLPAQFIIACYSFATIYFAFKFIEDNSKNIFLSILIFYTFTPFFFQTMNVVRQELAIFIFVYAIKFIKKGDLKKYLLLIISAGFFAHLTVLLTIPLYFVLRYNASLKMRAIIFSISLIIGPIILAVLRFTPYAFYLEYANNQGVISPVFLVEIVLAIFLYSTLYKSKSEVEVKNMCFIFLCLSGVSLVNWSSVLFYLLERILWYFLPFILILVPLYCEQLKKRKILFLFLFCILFTGIFTMSIVLNGESNNIVPYQTFFGNK